MIYTLYEDAFGDSRNAQALACAADYAYLSETEAMPKFQSDFGMAARLVSADNTQAYVCTSDDHIVVAFRGTESPTSIEGLKDWLLTDAVNLLMIPEGRLGTDLAAAGVAARFHQGFVNAIAEIWEPVYQAVDGELKNSDRPLWMTGHSLGGALALLAGWLFHRRMISVHQIYTFGGPMIGNADAVAAIDREFKGKIFRFVHSPDPVPRLPMMSLIANQYSHCEQQVAVGEGAAQDALTPFRKLAGKAVDGVLNATLIDDVWKDIAARVAAHGMVSYRKLIDSLLK
jgi:predicted lipase